MHAYIQVYIHTYIHTKIDIHNTYIVYMYSYATKYQHTYVCARARVYVRHAYKPPTPPSATHTLFHTAHHVTLSARARTHARKRAKTHAQTLTHTNAHEWSLPFHMQSVGLGHELVEISQFFVREMVVRRKVGADTLKDLRIDCFRGHAVPEGALVDAVLAK